MRRSLLLLAVVSSLTLLTGCGVDFVWDESRTEMFKGLELSGDRFVNRELTVSVEVESAYSVPVRLACYYEDRSRLSPEQRRQPFHERAALIGDRLLEPGRSEGHPAADAPRQTVRFAFSVSQPGSYVLGCLTPAAPENGISISFEVRPAVDAAAEAR